MNLTALLAEVYRRCNYATTPDTTVTTRLTAFLNETQQEILSEPGMEALLNDQVTFASVASTPEYSLPPAIARIKQIRETTNRWALTWLSEAEWRARYPDPTTLTGTPQDVVDLGYAAMASQPSDASELFVKSTDNATDTGAGKKAYIEGYITGGYTRSASVALTGTTAVSFGATITTWIAITKFYLDFTPVGNITINEDSGAGTELARIPIGQQVARYRHIALVPTPASAITYSVDFERDVTDLVNGTDEPVLPPRFHRLLAIGARAREYEKVADDERRQLALAEFDKGVRKLKFWLYSQAVGSPNLRGMIASPRPSQLGGYFPSGT